MVAACFAGSIGAARGQVVALHAAVVAMNMAVDLVGADLMVPQVASLARSLQQDIGPVDVGLDERVRVQNAAVHMGFSSKVDNRVDPILPKSPLHRSGIADVPAHKVQAASMPSLNIQQVLHPPSIGQLVVDHDRALWVPLQHVPDKITPNKAGAPGHK